MKISLIVIGDEILLGQVIDSNAATIAKLVYQEGLQIYKKWTVADKSDEIQLALIESSQQSDVILMTGGLGPTKDDITKKSLADFLMRPLVFNTVQKDHLEKILKPRGIPVTEMQLHQCYIPDQTVLLDNQMGTALGMWIEQQGKIYVSMPGVPYEMEFIMKHSVIPKLRNYQSGNRIIHQTVFTVGLGETEIASRIEPLLINMPEHISIAYLPSQGQVKIRLTASGSDEENMQQELDEYIGIIQTELEASVIGIGETSLERELGKLLKEHHKSLATAESCTGGYLAHRITSIPGSSDYFLGSVVAYQNRIKEALLNVSNEILEAQGAVSEACVIEMVKGCCRKFNSDFAIATSGIAGPGGGSPDKPVGTVWIAYGSKTQIETKKFQFTRDRIRNIEASASFAMILFWKFLKSKEFLKVDN